MPILTSPLIAGTARLRARTRPKAASSIRLAAVRISAPSGVGRMPSTCRVISTVPRVRSSSSILRRNALGESPMRSAAERMLPQRASSRNVRTASQSGPTDELKSTCSFSGPPRFTIIGIRRPCNPNNLSVDRRLWQPECAMTVHDRRTTRSAQALMGVPKPAKFGLEAPGLANLSQRLVAFNATFQDIETLLPRARRAMGGGAPNEVIHRVARHNPDSVWAIARRDRYANGEAVAEGFVALLMLTEEGADQLLSGELDATNPPLHLLTRQNEKPAAIYCWGMYALGAIAGGLSLVVEKASTPLYRDAPILVRTVTIEGLRMAQTLGFRPGAKFRGKTAPNFQMYPRGPSVKETRAIYDDFLDLESDQDVSITVVRSIEDFMRVVAVRSATFVAEQDCPYEEEFDGNDFSASHLLAYVGKEPVGCLRIRYFAGFAKLERLA